MTRDVDPSNPEPIAHVISRGWAADFLTRLALPVLALPPRHLYRVVIHGRGFELPVDRSEPITSFFVTLHVAARSDEEATAQARQRVCDRWEAFYPEATGELVVTIDEVERLTRRFARRSRSGFSFHGD